MLELSSPLFSTTYGSMENLIPPHDYNETNSYSSVLDFHRFDQIKHTSVQEYSSMKVDKKLNHNAGERDRRKRVNELYAFLRSLLPVSSDRKKRVSIPGTLSRTLNYIPELQKEVEILKRKKEKLPLYSTSTGNNRQENLGIKKQSAQDSTIETKLPAISSVNMLGDNEVVIQLISPTNNIKNKEINLLSKVLEYLEQEDQLVLINAMSFQSLGEGMLLSNLHFQVQGDHKIKAKTLKEMLDAFHDN